ncbi:hypothetical protein BS50DRAFT_584596 [Corynespora cassiicola Philippines]|uniref:Indoleamine 2,3-dioxygenase n=1 Tax=Corynespora cassiicola Philippines TaxID=1448308 RepID=A0A2T2P034_CORCC|nr:hypothetical protein BS50DRAFT_584596 [Corynespora cassiicola Philippines]
MADQPLATILPASHAVYEDLICKPELHEAIQSHILRQKVETLLILSVEDFNVPHKRRAYAILTFFANGYIWGNETEILLQLPCQLSSPLAQLGEDLGLRQLATYASTVL